MHAIVVGAGIAGLGAAHKLREAGHRVTLLEKEPEPGGRCQSVRWHDLWLVTGAFAFLGAEVNLIELATKLGIYEPSELLELADAHRWSVLVRRREMVDVGAFDLLAAARLPIIPLKEKVRLTAALPRLITRVVRSDPRDLTSAVALDDVNACEYFRRFSPALVDYWLEPCMAMFCGYGEDDYSLAWAAWSSAGRLSWAGKRTWSFRERGAGRLTWALGRHLAADPGCELRLGQEVAAVRQDASAIRVEVGGETLCGDAVIMAVPGDRVAGLMPDLDGERREFFESVTYAGHHIFYFLLDRGKEGLPDTCVLPAADGFHRTGNLRFIDLGHGVTLAHAQWKDAGCRQHADASADELLALAWADMVDAIPALEGAQVLDRLASLQPAAICKRPKGFVRRLHAFRQLPSLERVAFCGDYLSNSTVGQAHWSGLEAAAALIDRWV